MADSIEMMLVLDKIRSEKEVTVEKLTEGIISRRNYSRYLSGITKPSFEIIESLLVKLDISLLDFSLYIGNYVEANNQEEIEFRDLIRIGCIEKAYKDYYPRLKDKKLKTVYNKKAIPLGLLYIDYYLNKITKYEVISRAKKIIDINNLNSTSIIDDDTVEALFIYSNFCNALAKRKIIQYLAKVNFEENYKLFLAYYQQSRLLVYITVLKCLTTLEEISDEDKDLIDKILKEALKFNIKSRMKMFGFLLFETIYKFIRKLGIRNKHITYYYMTEIFISSYDIIKTKKSLLKRIDYDEYESYISEIRNTDETMYERILKDGIFK